MTPKAAKALRGISRDTAPPSDFPPRVASARLSCTAKINADAACGGFCACAKVLTNGACVSVHTDSATRTFAHSAGIIGADRVQGTAAFLRYAAFV